MFDKAARIAKLESIVESLQKELQLLYSAENGSKETQSSLSQILADQAKAIYELTERLEDLENRWAIPGQNPPAIPKPKLISNVRK